MEWEGESDPSSCSRLPTWSPSSAGAHLATLAESGRGGGVEDVEKETWAGLPALLAAHTIPPLPGFLFFIPLDGEGMGPHPGLYACVGGA